MSRRRKDAGSSLRYSPNFWQSLMRVRSSHRSTSLKSSASVLLTAHLAMTAAAVSWSNDAASSTWASGATQVCACVVTRMRDSPLECTYVVTSWV